MTEKTLQDILGIPSAPELDSEPRSPSTHTELVVPVPAVPRPAESSVEADATYVRDNLLHIIETGSTALKELAEVASESRHPRAYETIALLIKNLGDTTDKMLKLAKEKRELVSDTPATGNVYIANAVFTGSTKDLLQIIKDNQIVETIDAEIVEVTLDPQTER
jgi:hypothetical protein